MNQADSRYDRFIGQDFSQLPPGKFKALDVDGFYQILVGREPSDPKMFNITLLNFGTGSIMPVLSPQDDIKIHIDNAIAIASEQVTQLYAAIAALDPNLE